VGGGARLPQIEELAKETLRLPIQVGFPSGFGGILDKVDDPSFATVAGLVLWSKGLSGNKQHPASQVFGGMSKSASQTIGKMRCWIGKFLP